MGLFDTIKKSTGIDYLETAKPKKINSPSTPRAVSNQDKQLKAMEYRIQKIIEDLQEIQEKLRVRRGI
jgi:hypothetical protein